VTRGVGKQMKIIVIIALAFIFGSAITLAYWHLTIRQLNAAPPVPSEQIPDWKTLWRNYPFFASGLLISGAHPFSGKSNDIDDISRT